jgi:branched-chain amino acid transport system permease protein
MARRCGWRCWQADWRQPCWHFCSGRAILRLRGAYFALATIGVNEAMRAFVNNFEPFGAATGLSLNFQVYNDYGGALQALWMAYYILLGVAVLTVLPELRGEDE